MSDRDNRRLLVSYPRALPLLIFIAVTAITIMSVFAIERGARQRDEALMARTGTAMASALERRASVNASYLRAGSALFSTLGQVNRTDFNRFVTELRLDSDYRGAEGYGWAPMLSLAEVPEFNRVVNEYRLEPVTIKPSLADQPRAELVPVMMLQPDTARNRLAVGYDMYSDSVRREAMLAAARDKRPTASGKVVLVQEGGGNSPGFLVYMPVYRTIAGQKSLIGYIYSPFNAQDFLSSAGKLVDRQDVGVKMYDGEPSEENWLGTLEGGVAEGKQLQQPVRISNRSMTIVLQSTRTGALSMLSMVTLLFGLAVACLLMLLSRLLTQQAIEDQRSLNWFAEQNSIRDSLTRELNHRVKNTLANVLSIIALTRRRSSNVDDFADGLDGRIRALSATHDLLTQSEWGTTPIASVVNAELAPYVRDESHEIVFDGPEVELAPNDALSLGLALHELATNASKYGSLSREGGQVSVRWEMIEDKLARIHWRESGGPEVISARTRGFGMDLIEKIVAHELRHPVELIFDPGGVRCTLLVPVREPRPFEIRAKKRPVRGH